MANKLSAKWQLQAAMLSRPADLSSLVSLSLNKPEQFFKDDTLHVMVNKLLNCTDSNKADHDTKLDILAILANLAAGDSEAREEVKYVLMGVSEWFDEYMQEMAASAEQDNNLHKAMALLLARAYDYKIKTEDLLELCQNDRCLALQTVLGVLEDGETYSTDLIQRQRPGDGRLGQWEHAITCQRHEKPMVLQMCRLVRGFTHPATYFNNRPTQHGEEDLALYSVEEFSGEMDSLLNLALNNNIIGKLTLALHSCLFTSDESEDGQVQPILTDEDHQAVHSINMFIQNLYSYASKNTADFRAHLLSDTLLVPRLVLPYLDVCARQANQLSQAMGDDEEWEGTGLFQGMASSLRVLVIASFRALPTKSMLGLLRRLNPSASLLQAGPFIRRHDYLFSLLCLLNVNMGALDLSRDSEGGRGADDGLPSSPHNLLAELSSIYQQMELDAQARVLKRVAHSGALPTSRDTPPYAAIMQVLLGGEERHSDCGLGWQGQGHEDEGELREDQAKCQDDDKWENDRRAMKEESAAHVRKHSRESQRENGPSSRAEGKAPERGDFNGAKGQPSATTRGLLGDLPCLNKPRDQEEMQHQLRMRIDLGLPSQQQSSLRKSSFMRNAPEEKQAPQESSS
ncbi:unnamed protein product [Chrysoparadoxa australica]